LKYKELKSFLDTRARLIDELTMQVMQLKNMLTQKPLLGIDKKQ
jgi:hypothetical protein